MIRVCARQGSDLHRVRLPPKRPVYTDPLLEKVLDRLRREELPDLGGGVETAIKFVDSR
jgi:hypothetical protein